MNEAIHRRTFKSGTAGQATTWPDTARHAAATEARRRSFELALLALASTAVGVTLLLSADTWLGASDIASGSGLAAVAGVIVPLLVVLAALELVLAYGLWALRSWAWPLGVGLTIAALVFTEIGAGRGSAGVHTASLLLEIGTLWYLLSPSAHRTMKPQSDDAES